MKIQRIELKFTHVMPLICTRIQNSSAPEPEITAHLEHLFLHPLFLI